MKCPHCGHLATDTDRVCYTCKHYIGNVRMTEKIGGETNYARLFPLIFVLAGVPMILMVYQKYVPGANRLSVYDFERVCLILGLGFLLATAGWIVGRLLGDGTTVRI
jgi:hypothetical protein